MIKPEDILSNPDILLEESKNLVDALIEITKYNPVPGEFLDLEKKKNYGNIMIDDFGDYIPFVAWLGKLVDAKYFQWANRKGRYIIHNFQMPNGLFFTNYDVSKSSLPKNHNMRIFDADKMSDTILGVNLMYEISHDDFYLHSSKKFFEGFSKYFISENGYVYFKICPKFFKVPFSMGKFNGLYIEEAINLYRFTKDDSYINLANRMAYPWINNSFVKGEGLFPFVCINSKVRKLSEYLFKKNTSFSFDTVMMTKSNTNLVNALVNLNSLSQSQTIINVLNNWVTNVRDKLYRNGILYAVWSKENKYDIHYLGSDHAVVDSLLEVYRLLGNDGALKLASEIVDSILARQSSSGLLPEIVYNYDTKNINERMLNVSMLSPNISRLDTHTDLSIMLLKFYDLTNNKKYLNTTLSIICGILNHHKYNEYYVEFVDTKTLEKKSYIIETKMLFLLNKLFLIVNYVLKGNKICDNQFILNIERDR